LQEPFLFRGTVWENLVYGRPEARPEAALTAARGANAHDFILRLPLGYDTPLGERGAGLSGGEKQRLSIARTLLYDPAILILDEATSSVDTESEKAIQDALAVLTRGRTSIAIAHRLSTLRNSDRILVMDQGRLIEEGSHEELMAQGGTYAKLVRIQTHVKAGESVDGLLTVAVAALADESAPPRKAAPARRPAAELWERWQAGDNGGPDETAEFAPRWLRPGSAQFRRGPHDSLALSVGGEMFAGLFAVRALPASYPRQFISLRYADADGEEHEVGLVRDLDEWPGEAQELINEALARRYLVRVITAVEGITLKHGLLTFRVQTESGSATFIMRNSHSQAQDYGDRGKMLNDVDENRYLVPDVKRLPRRQRTLFRHYVYW
jgi:hypothetical protein